MRVLIVAALPDDDVPEIEMLREATAIAIRTLKTAGHHVVVIDLAADGFCPVMTAADRRAYFGEAPLVDALTDRYAAEVVRAEALVVVDRTVLSTLSPLLKGWLDRVLVPGVSFTKEERSGKVRRGLHSVRWIVGIATYEEGRWETLRTSNGGRRIILRVVRLCARPRTRTAWVPLYGVSTVGAAQRAEFLRRVERRMTAL